MILSTELDFLSRCSVLMKFEINCKFTNRSLTKLSNNVKGNEQFCPLIFPLLIFLQILRLFEMNLGLCLPQVGVLRLPHSN